MPTTPSQQRVREQPSLAIREPKWVKTAMSAIQAAARAALASQPASASQPRAASQQQSGRHRANSSIQPTRQRPSQRAAVAQQASHRVGQQQQQQQQQASSQPASQTSNQPASQPASRPAAEPASLSTALFFAALLCSTSPPAETRLTVCRRSQHFKQLVLGLLDVHFGQESHGTNHHFMN